MVIVLFLSSCLNTTICLGQQQALQPDEYAVYAVIAQTLFIGNGTDQVIFEKRISGNRVDDHKSISNQIGWKFSELMSSTIDDYLQKSRKAVYLDVLFHLPVKYFLIAPKEVDSFFKKGGGRWDAFYKKYPKSPGLLALSRVGFNQERNQALLYVNLSCGSLCGEGSWILLEKKAAVWAIRNQYTSVRS